ncbi:dihydroorotase [Hellea sp.]|nr:dihydroorotase [Hellea sp.]MDA8889284.1 dihydroorotase [Hellea sp.]MDB4844563.1 dihydroorotase [Hellea sp.]MDC0422192.1 dihydroorotase [Hellea sp.]MDC1061909.1 dihydroorotase [Hellea sp.]MDC1088445.1 dihydroorotase [Hellea sp.]
MNTSTIINARIINPEDGYDKLGSILIESGTISDFGPEVKTKGQIIDAQGLVCAPGLIDMRVNTGEPGKENRETINTAAKAAAAGGITSIVLMPDTNPVIDDISLVDFINRKAENAPINIFAAGALTKNLDGSTLTEIGLMSEAGALMFSNGALPITNAQTMRRLLSYSSNFDCLISSRPLESSLSINTVAHESDFSARLGLSSSPAVSELIIVQRDIALAELTDGKLLIDLISFSKSLNAIKQAKLKHPNISCSVSINHLSLNENDIGDYRTFAKLDPPLREESDRLALLKGINQGIIDVIVSSHDPRPAGEKRLPYAQAASGAIGLETLLAAGLSLVADKQLNLMKFLAALTCNPAKLLGLDSGRISKSAPADLIIFDPNTPWVCKGKDFLSKSKNTPFDGRLMTGRNIKTICKGKLVFDFSN